MLTLYEQVVALVDAGPPALTAKCASRSRARAASSERHTAGSCSWPGPSSGATWMPTPWPTRMVPCGRVWPQQLLCWWAPALAWTRCWSWGLP